ncbi:hypothetical protein D9758_015929 [Tetrapyrgos nigripes]|uniref:Uncharacterized protein n=1 Tax=Tetrapyrgos nigripes TaxID=182062 RepID=A0A8H5FHI9_9AGAR|nr:hypothetical protein D9758_015929 [Tetrapyrgos nigripes]
MNVYVLPARSQLRWEDWMTTEPFHFLCTKIRLAHELSYPLIVMGDLNARTGISHASEQHPFRISLDSKPSDSRGKQLLQCLDACDVFILNGAESIPGDHFHFTEHHNAGKDDQGENIYQCTVIDYALASMECSPFITNFEVSPRTDWSDHSFLSLSIILPGGPPSLPSSSYSHLRPKFHTPLVSELDQLLDHLMKQPFPSLEEQWSNIYGLATLEDHARPPLVVHISGACSNEDRSNATAGSGIFFGFRNTLNMSKRVPGTRSHYRAEVYAVLLALQLAPPDRALFLYLTSESLTHSLTYGAPGRAKCGWTGTGAHGELFKCVALEIAARSAPVKFIKLISNSANDHQIEATALAKAGCQLPFVIMGDKSNHLSLTPPGPRFRYSLKCQQISPGLHLHFLPNTLHHLHTHVVVMPSGIVYKLPCETESLKPASLRPLSGNSTKNFVTPLLLLPRCLYVTCTTASTHI